MRFWPTVVGSFYNPRTYSDARLIYSGFAVGYSIYVALFIGLLVLIYTALTEDFSGIGYKHLLDLLVITGIALLFRAAMLLALTVAARLLAHLFKLPLTNSQAARITTISYTPVAFFDAAAFCFGQTALSPPYLFVLGAAMLLAALNAAK